MDWSNERYVRLYVRDTTTWKRLGWYGQNALMQLLRKVDRSGTLELDGLEPWEALVLHCHAPESDARRGLDLCIAIGVLEQRNGMLVFPNFIDAQESIKSDRLRARELRERKARGERTNETHPESSRKVTDSSRGVTPSHDESRGVTPRHSVLCSAVQSSAVQSSAVTVSLPADEPANDLGERRGATAQVVRRFYAELLESIGTFPTQSSATADACAAVVAWAEQAPEPYEALQAAFYGFRADAYAAERRYPLGLLASQASKYHLTGQPLLASALAAKAAES